MIDRSHLLPKMEAALVQRFGDHFEDFFLPPPVFLSLQGEFLDFMPDSATLIARFPVLGGYLNPYGALQGGIIAALVDNTIGPLSMLIAPPSVTRSLELTYNRSITLDLKNVIVSAQLVERIGEKLIFKASVRDVEGNKLARAKSTHWILPSEV